MRRIALDRRRAGHAGTGVWQRGSRRSTCTDGVCRVTLTPPQLLAAAERLVGERHYAEAKPLVVALRMAVGLQVADRLPQPGSSPSRTGQYAEAAERFTAILADDPRQTRVRLELAQALMALGKSARADRQLRLAQQDVELPEAVARTIRTARDTIRSSPRLARRHQCRRCARHQHQQRHVRAVRSRCSWAATPISADLNEQARARSGLGETAQFSGGLRLPVAPQRVGAGGAGRDRHQLSRHRL